MEYVASDEDDSGVVLDEAPSPEVPADPDPAPWPEEFEDDDRVIVRLGGQTTKASAKLFDRAELPGDLKSLRLERK